MHYNPISFADLSEIYESGPEDLQTSVTCGGDEQLDAAGTSLGTIRAWPATDDTSGIETSYHLISEHPLAEDRPSLRLIK